MPVSSYSTTAANNNSAPPAGAPEGMAPSAVNDTIRAIMADIAVEAQTNAVKRLGSVAGTNTITGSMSPALTAYATGMIVVFTPANNTTGAATININSLGARSIVKGDGTALESGDLQASTSHVLVYDGTNFVCLNPLSFNLTNGTLSGTLSVTGALTLNGALTTDNSSADEVGFKGLPQSTQNAYTCVLSDAGRCIQATADGTTITIPANASVAYPVGTVLTVIANTSASISIAINSDGLYLAGTAFGTTGTRTLAAGGIATAYKYASTSWLISGTGLS